MLSADKSILRLRSLKKLLLKPLRRLIYKGQWKFFAGILKSMTPKRDMSVILKKLGKLLKRGLEDGLAIKANAVAQFKVKR